MQSYKILMLDGTAVDAHRIDGNDDHAKYRTFDGRIVRGYYVDGWAYQSAADAAEAMTPEEARVSLAGLGDGGNVADSNAAIVAAAARRVEADTEADTAAE